MFHSAAAEIEVALLGVSIVTSEAMRAHACHVFGCFIDGPVPMLHSTALSV